MIDNNEITLRKAVLEDAETIFRWRNEPDTRRYFFNPDEIKWDDHLKWFSDALNNNDRIILIGKIKNNPIGVLRYDLKADESEVDIYLVPGLYGNGLGTNLLKAGNQWLRVNMPHIKNVIAKIINKNIASQKAFQKAGFNEFYSAYKYIVSDSI